MNLNPFLTKDLVAELGIASLPADKQAEILEGASRVIYQSILARVVSLLDDASAIEFNNLLETKPEQDAVVNFLTQKISNLDEITLEEVARFKEDASMLLGNIG